MTVDEEEFDSLMVEQRERARAARRTLEPMLGWETNELSTA